MPYKIFDNSISGSRMENKESTWDSLEALGWDLIAFTDRFAIFHKPPEKPKRAYNKKVKENDGNHASVPATAGEQGQSRAKFKGVVRRSSAERIIGS